MMDNPTSENPQEEAKAPEFDLETALNAQALILPSRVGGIWGLMGHALGLAIIVGGIAIAGGAFIYWFAHTFSFSTEVSVVEIVWQILVPSTILGVFVGWGILAARFLRALNLAKQFQQAREQKVFETCDSASSIRMTFVEHLERPFFVSFQLLITFLAEVHCVAKATSEAIPLVYQIAFYSLVGLQGLGLLALVAWNSIFHHFKEEGRFLDSDQFPKNDIQDLRISACLVGAFVALASWMGSVGMDTSNIKQGIDNASWITEETTPDQIKEQVKQITLAQAAKQCPSCTAFQWKGAYLENQRYNGKTYIRVASVTKAYSPKDAKPQRYATLFVVPAQYAPKFDLLTKENSHD